MSFLQRTALILFAALVPTVTLATDKNDPKVLGALGFLSDAASYQGQYYSVYDFCKRYADPIVLELSLNTWLSNNDGLIQSQNRIEKWFISKIIADGGNNESVEAFKSLVEKMMMDTRKDDRLYRDIYDIDDKRIACDKKLGNMNSGGMQFKNVAKDSYRFMANILNNDSDFVGAKEK